MIKAVRDLPVAVLFLSVALYPINFSLLGLRLIDILFIIVFLISLPFLSVKKRENLILAIIFWVLLLSSVFFGSILKNDYSTDRLIFFYKYFFLFGVTLLLFNLRLSKHNIEKLVALMFVSHIFLALWVFIYIYSVNAGLLHGSLRVSFPFSTEYVSSDAHLYSSVLAIGALFFTLTYRRNFNSKVVFGLFLLVSVSALLLTGSRTGVVIYGSGTFLYAILRGGRSLVAGMCTSVLFIIVLFSAPLAIEPSLSEYFVLLERIVSTDVFNDSSFEGRVRKMMVGIEDSAYSLHLLGIGVLHSSLLWYDSLIGVLLSHVGLVGAITLVVLVWRFWRDAGSVSQNLSGSGLVFTIVMFCYVLSNLITEYFLISRSVFPFLVYSFILRAYMKSEASPQRLLCRVGVAK